MLRTKLHRPPITPDILIRPNLVEQLEENLHKPLTLVSAPAGYGKSTLISSWLEVKRNTNGWISLGEDDNDFRQFLEYLIFAVRNQYPQALARCVEITKAKDLPPLRVFAEEFLNELDEIVKEDFILVLDDYHLVKDPRLNEFLDLYINYPPQNVHLVIITQIDPALNLSMLRIHNRIHEVRLNDLSFSKEEIQLLISNLDHLELNDEVLGNLQKTTEGWIAGIRLATMTIHHLHDTDKFFPSSKSGLVLVSEFLASEVLLKQSEQVQEFLLVTSVLDRFCSDLVDAVVGPKDELNGPRFIEWLVKSNMFVIPLDDSHQWFRYHHLFKSLLLDQLERKVTRKEIEHYHLKAGRWFERENMGEDAIHHLVAAGDLEGVVDIVEKNRHFEIEQDRWYKLERWLKVIPGQILVRRPVLLLTRAWIFYQQTRVEEMTQYLGYLMAILISKKGQTRSWPN